MTVAELIVALSAMPAEAIVVIRASHWGEASEIYEIMDAELDRGQVVLEESSQAS